MRGFKRYHKKLKDCMQEELDALRGENKIVRTINPDGFVYYKWSKTVKAKVGEPIMKLTLAGHIAFWALVAVVVVFMGTLFMRNKVVIQSGYTDPLASEIVLSVE